MPGTSAPEPPFDIPPVSWNGWQQAKQNVADEYGYAIGTDFLATIFGRGVDSLPEDCRRYLALVPINALLLGMGQNSPGALLRWPGTPAGAPVGMLPESGAGELAAKLHESGSLRSLSEIEGALHHIALAGSVRASVSELTGGDLAAHSVEPESAEVRREVKSAPTRPAKPFTHYTKWRGFFRMTKQPVECRCGKCGHQWVVEAAVANTVADAQGLGNRMVRSGTRMQNTGSQITPGAGSRQAGTAAQMSMQDADLMSTFALILCPSCRQLDTSLRVLPPSA